jgi:tRNA 2-(methylsulfanyl)-N6-isopentenyladenosine37 hydroxylase
MSEKRVLGLQLPTDPRWVNMAEISIGDILTDHAYCEQKAATTGISLIVQYPDHPELVDAIAPVVTEEWGHFRMVLRELKKRKLPLGRQRKDEYVNELFKHIRKNGKREEMLMDKLLVLALVEARSCERFRLLSLHISDDSLKAFYHDLMVSEAGHYRMFLELAESVMPEDVVEKRWKEFLAIEAEIMKGLEVRGDRMH